MLTYHVFPPDTRVPQGFLQTPTHYLPVMDIHGTSDHTVPANASSSKSAYALSTDGWYYEITGNIASQWFVGLLCGLFLFFSFKISKIQTRHKLYIRTQYLLIDHMSKSLSTTYYLHHYMHRAQANGCSSSKLAPYTPAGISSSTISKNQLVGLRWRSV